MGLRSRQRRLAGVSREDSYDAEATRHQSHQSLEDHLRASIDDVSAFNLMWKSTIGYAGLVLVTYELVLVYQMLATANAQGTSRLSLCVLLKLVGFASILSSRQYVQTGRVKSLGLSVFFTAAYALVWLCCTLLLGLRFTAIEVSPLSPAYFVVAFATLRLVGDNTKAEAERAKQLQKLRALVHQSSH